MERVVHKTTSHAEAHTWDVEQHATMTPQARLSAARKLKDRAYPSDSKDVRDWHRSR